MLEIVTTLPKLLARDPEGHKGSYGRVLVVAGSRGMSGAAVLCGSAALRAGAGLVKVAVPAEILPIVAAGNVCYTTAALPHDAEGRLAFAALPAIVKLCEAHDVIAIGPGLGQSAELASILFELVAQIARPMVIDADGINAIVGHLDKLNSTQGPRIVTPHPREFARLLHAEAANVQANRQTLAVEFAEEQELIVVLKGQGTLVTDGQR